MSRLQRRGWTTACIALALMVPGCLQGEPVAAQNERTGFSGIPFAPGHYNTSGPLSRVLSPGPYKVASQEVVELKSKIDGVPLVIGLIRPDVPNGTRVPVIAHMSTYIRAMKGMTDLRGAVGASGETGFGSFLIDNFVPHGYAVAFIPARGVADNGGCFAYGSPAETSDYDQAITWLGEQPWSTGAVGAIGLSMGGISQWEVASTGNPHLRTIVPVESVPDFFSTFWVNGTSSPLLLAFTVAHYTGVAYQNAEPAHPELLPTKAACPGYERIVAAFEESRITGTRDSLGEFAVRDHRAAVERNYRGSVLLVHGFADGFVRPRAVLPWIDRLQERGIVVKEMLGQWHHADPDMDNSSSAYPGNLAPAPTFGRLGNPTLRWDWAETVLHWYDHWLKDDMTQDIGPRVEVADTSNQWRTETAWPPQDAQLTTLYLDPKGTLGSAPSTQTSTTVIAPDPARFALPLDKRSSALAAQCPTCLVFVTEPYAREMRFAGMPHVNVSVTPLGPAGHISARLVDVGPKGEKVLTTGIMDLRFADGTETPHAVVPGNTLMIRIEMEPTDAVVPAGDHLELVLSEAGQGNDDLAGGITYATPTATAPVEVTIGGSSNFLTLETFERGTAAFFTPPSREG